METSKIDNIMSLITNQKGSIDDPSKSDLYYKHEVKRLKSGHIFSWNWAAFLGGYIWLFYRKMNKEAFIVLAITNLPAFLEIVRELIFYSFTNQTKSNVGTLNSSHNAWFLWASNISFEIHVLLAILLGVFGNLIYLHHLQEKTNVEKQPKETSNNVSLRNAILACVCVAAINFAFFGHIVHTISGGRESIGVHYNEGH
jgi:hypothetical protein